MSIASFLRETSSSGSSYYKGLIGSYWLNANFDQQWPMASDRAYSYL